MTSNLSDISYFVNEKINIEELNDSTYISTENMLPDKGGVTKSSGLPNANYTQCFSEGDILLSNIRPYFKKIWYATFNGGCSNDVLVLRAKSNVCSKFLYYVLSDDKFFEYDTATSKGTKMPRGDKVAIMKYSVPQYDLPTQEKIARVLSSLDDKIELNNKINQNLEQQAQAIFNTYIAKYSSTKYKVKDVILTANTGADAIQKAPIVDYDTGIRCVRVGDLSNNRNFWQWGFTKVTNDVFEQYQLKRDDIIVTRTATLGLNRLITENLNAVYNNGLIRITVDNNKIFPLLLYQHFQTKDFFNYISRIESETSVRPNMKINYLLDYEFSYLKLTEQNELVKILTPLLQTVEINNVENEKLTQLRDTLLPKLMSGEIDVDKVEV